MFIDQGLLYTEHFRNTTYFVKYNEVSQTVVLNSVYIKDYHIQEMNMVCEVQGSKSNWCTDMSIPKQYYIQDFIIVCEVQGGESKAGILTNDLTNDYCIQNMIMDCEVQGSKSNVCIDICLELGHLYTGDDRGL